MQMRTDVGVWVDEKRCKACNLCVSYCPSGAIAMRDEPHAVLGKMIEVIHPEYCIGCRDCELHCPDFAIFVANPKEFKFAKLSEESKALAQKIKANNFQKIN
ncbi:4Fe-4S binding protein [Campylobacter canadensis]|uniref:4Fe-4S binding protein n=1 Tax=Campylobacter canadensis TaxID=449520 RepID=A0ABS7WS04_9BACT|nr:4Fe-4S binding protein [Campylobacter canadensis]MBZ7987536.1 4Fe-4S binding protein [Campylobacter canadensis]MBZ7994881.1 4Fe-4S binding protein [Campylobacter canadensis]MBZ7996732.1 4Fe-4S binding protein [Campylobacter canadensis]MBZ7998708.1 4Fe-4S binding protein [Campylobacter canadensis]MBZ8000298.1 4Fe-4S binding protein [Campylobacter canadensis]